MIYSVTYLADGEILRDKGIKKLSAYIEFLEGNGHTIIAVQGKPKN